MRWHQNPIPDPARAPYWRRDFLRGYYLSKYRLLKGQVASVGHILPRRSDLTYGDLVDNPPPSLCAFVSGAVRFADYNLNRASPSAHAGRQP